MHCYRTLTWQPCIISKTNISKHYQKTVEKLEKLEKVVCPRNFPFWVYPDVTNPCLQVPAPTPIRLNKKNWSTTPKPWKK